jgi:hypothetical protein
VVPHLGEGPDQRQDVVLALVLVPVALQQRLLHFVALVAGQAPAVDHVVQDEVGDLVHGAGLQVQQDRPVQDQAAQLEQRVQREGGHVRLRPPVAALLHVLLELDPPGCLLPLHVAALHHQLLHLREERVALVLLIVDVFAEDELDALGRGRACQGHTMSGEKETKTVEIIINHAPSARVQRKKKIIIITVIIEEKFNMPQFVQRILEKRQSEIEMRKVK